MPLVKDAMPLVKEPHSPPQAPPPLAAPKLVCRFQRGAADHFQWPLLRIPVSLPYKLAARILTEQQKGKQIMAVWTQGER